RVRRIQFARNLCIAPFVATFVVATFLPIVSWKRTELGLAWRYFIDLVFVGFFLCIAIEWSLSFIKCPACHLPFFSGPTTCLRQLRNAFSRRCLSYGLRINGGNAAECG